MIITTEFSIGQHVWMLYRKQPIECIVSEIIVPKIVNRKDFVPVDKNLAGKVAASSISEQIRYIINGIIDNFPNSFTDCDIEFFQEREVYERHIYASAEEAKKEKKKNDFSEESFKERNQREKDERKETESMKRMLVASIWHQQSTRPKRYVDSSRILVCIKDTKNSLADKSFVSAIYDRKNDDFICSSISCSWKTAPIEKWCYIEDIYPFNAVVSKQSVNK